MPAILPPIAPPDRRAADLIFHVDEVDSGHRRSEFAGVAHRLYRGDHRWIPPFRSAHRDALRPERNPLLHGSDLGAFLGVAQNLGLGDEAVGSLAAWPGDFDDETGAWGYWGLFEAMNVGELAERLFYKGETWLFEHTPGIAGLRGPWSVEPLVSPGLLTDGFDALPMAFLPYNPPYYPEMIEAQDYEPGMTWRTFSLDLPSQPHPTQRQPPVAAAVWVRSARLYASQGEGGGGLPVLVPGLLPWLEDLAGAATFPFNRSWRFAVGRAFSRAVTVLPDEDKAAAACFGVPDIGAGLRLSRGRQWPFGWLLFELGLRLTRRLRVFPAAVPGHWQAGQIAELYASLAAAAVEAGYRELHVAPIPDNDELNLEALASLGARAAQQFTIYEKPL